MALQEGTKLTALQQVNSPMQDGDFFYVVRNGVSYRATYEELLSAFSNSQKIEITGTTTATIISQSDIPSTLIKFIQGSVPEEVFSLKLVLDTSTIRVGIPQTFVFVNNTDANIRELPIEVSAQSNGVNEIVHNGTTTYYNVSSSSAIAFQVIKPYENSYELSVLWISNGGDGILPDNITTQGNTFNGIKQLVQTGTDGKVPIELLPAVQGGGVVTSVQTQADMLIQSSEVIKVGAITEVLADPSINKNGTYLFKGGAVSTLGNWTQLFIKGTVLKVNGKDGAVVTLTKDDIGLGEVDNTSDLNKPISNATQTALNAKAPLQTGTQILSCTDTSLNFAKNTEFVLLSSSALGDITYELVFKSSFATGSNAYWDIKYVFATSFNAKQNANAFKYKILSVTANGDGLGLSTIQLINLLTLKTYSGAPTGDVNGVNLGNQVYLTASLNYDLPVSKSTLSLTGLLISSSPDIYLYQSGTDRAKQTLGVVGTAFNNLTPAIIPSAPFVVSTDFTTARYSGYMPRTIATSQVNVGEFLNVIKNTANQIITLPPLNSVNVGDSYVFKVLGTITGCIIKPTTGDYLDGVYNGNKLLSSNQSYTFIKETATNWILTNYNAEEATPHYTGFIQSTGGINVGLTQFFVVVTSGTNPVVKLPAISLASTGNTYVVKVLSGVSGCTIIPTTGEKIDNVTDKVISADSSTPSYSFVKSDSGTWWRI